MRRNLFLRQATAYALGGHLDGPVRRVIEPHACASLVNVGSSSLVKADSYSHDGVSYESAQSEIMGMPSAPEEKTHVTMIRTSIHGLNIMNTVTARAVHARMVITTDEPGDPSNDLGLFSKFNFQGTAFEDLRIAGAPFFPSNNPPIPNNRGNGDAHPYDELVDRLETTYRATNGVRLVTTLIRNEHTVNQPAVNKNREVVKEADEAIKAAPDPQSIQEAKSNAAKSLRKNETLPIHIKDFGELHIAQLHYNPYFCCLSMLRVEVNCGAFRGRFEIAAMRGGGSCWPIQST